ncbi:hypothetical protein ABH935_009178 [Catenulispora sp. GAS73]|uniref:toll/interleukin-1 receptor domain-containing protein n=1 Tax=Catenulispora sp. GAS73 TaxID=3156269 RepID=UPI00351695A3
MASDRRPRMPKRKPLIFISYRGGGGDAKWAPDLVHHELAAKFGKSAVFKAGHNLRAGDEFPPKLEDMAASCPVMLVCIGPEWLAAQNADGTRRLEDAHDWVRREIELALKNGNRVVPLLLGDRDEISIPAPHDLPADIAPLAHRQAVRLEPGGRLRITLPDLATQLADMVPELAKRKRSRDKSGIKAAAEVGEVQGKAVVVRADGTEPRRVDAKLKADVITATGEVTIVDLIQRPRT